MFIEIHSDTARERLINRIITRVIYASSSSFFAKQRSPVAFDFTFFPRRATSKPVHARSPASARPIGSVPHARSVSITPTLGRRETSSILSSSMGLPEVTSGVEPRTRIAVDPVRSEKWRCTRPPAVRNH